MGSGDHLGSQGIAQGEGSPDRSARSSSRRSSQAARSQGDLVVEEGGQSDREVQVLSQASRRA